VSATHESADPITDPETLEIERRLAGNPYRVLFTDPAEFIARVRAGYRLGRVHGGVVVEVTGAPAPAPAPSCSFGLVVEAGSTHAACACESDAEWRSGRSKP
jgi:hypothetical protein